jgi:hypothetical protein
VIDLRGNDPAEVHTNFHSYVERARLDRANGGHSNQIIWTGVPPLTGDPTAGAQSIVLLDDWLNRITSDRRRLPLRVKVPLDKPADAVDACWIAGQRITDEATCRAAFPYWSDLRIAGGGPWTDDILKCRLRPLDPTPPSTTASPSRRHSGGSWSRSSPRESATTDCPEWGGPRVFPG